MTTAPNGSSKKQQGFRGTQLGEAVDLMQFLAMMEPLNETELIIRTGALTPGGHIATSELTLRVV